MRPLTLKIQAFGPFASTQNLDFSEVGKNPLFLICGSTGSGKTTILDAICFALYGDSSGQVRNPKEMRSDHADGATVTEVVLDFSLGDRTYRVHRIPEQDRPKKRGPGITTQKSAADIWDRTGCSEADEGSVLATGWSKVTAKVHDLIGFHADQFRQVIMLPQGRFRDLLDAKSQDREDILEQLFPTEIYALIQNALRERAKEIENLLRELQRKRSTLLEHHELEDEVALADRLASLEEEVQKLEALLNRREKELLTVSKALSDGRALEGHFQELADGRAEKETLDARAAEIDEKQEILRLGQVAAGLSDLFARLRRTEKSLEEARQESAARADELAEAEKALETAKNNLDREEGRDEERQRLAKGIAALAGFLEKAGPLKEAIQDRTQKEEVLEGALLTAKNAEMAVSQLQKAVESSKEKLESTRTLAVQFGELDGKLKASKEALHDREKLRAAQQKLSDSGNKAQRLEEALEQAVKDLASSEDELRNARASWEKGQAALLARDLEPDAPCPVCGSSHHPRPATSGDDIPSEEQLQTLERSVEKSRNQKHHLDGEIKEAKGVRKALESQITDLMERLGPDAKLPFDEMSIRHEALITEHQQVQNANDEIPQLLGDCEKQGMELEQARNSFHELEETTAAAKRALEVAEALVGEREASIPVEYRDPGELAEALKKEKKLLEEAEEALTTTQRATTAAEVTRGKAEGSARSSEEGLVKAEKSFASDQEIWVARRRSAGFNTDQEYEEALLEAAEREAFSLAIEEHMDALIRVKANIKRAVEHTENKDRPNIQELEDSEKKAESAKNEVRDQWTTAKGEREKLEGLTVDLKEICEGIGVLKRRYGIVGRLSDVANGRRMTFQRYVLAALLDDVLLAASERLEVMSRGRYRLVRRRVQADLRSHAGLDLDVEDAYTGKARSVSSLSGGESFQAALSLAMGLAEVVQSYAGGIRLDTIFVDEGFGSLDPEALDSAVNALVDLQQGGRMVGVISHVPELKERIDVRLDVTGSRAGSTAKFVVP